VKRKDLGELANFPLLNRLLQGTSA